VEDLRCGIDVAATPVGLEELAREPRARADQRDDGDRRGRGAPDVAALFAAGADSASA
jgi:hypothetical protein